MHRSQILIQVTNFQTSNWNGQYWELKFWRCFSITLLQKVNKASHWLGAMSGYSNYFLDLPVNKTYSPEIDIFAHKRSCCIHIVRQFKIYNYIFLSLIKDSSWRYSCSSEFISRNHSSGPVGKLKIYIIVIYHCR